MKSSVNPGWIHGGKPTFKEYLKSAHLDLPLLLALGLLAVLGLLILYSAIGEEFGLLKKQGIHLLVGFSLMLGIAQIPPWWFRMAAPWLYALGLLLLVAVLLVGSVGGGAQRWLDFRVIKFQPSEIMKIAMPMMLAWFVGRERLPVRWDTLLWSFLLLALPVLLIVQQPDLGTSLLIAVAGGFVIFLGGLSWRLLLVLVLTIVSLAPVVWQFFMRGYQQSRVLVFLDPEKDPLGAGWNTIQAKIAIGSGGLYGKGWLAGTQSQLEFIPERSTDFIFAVFAEEFGLLGGIGLLGLYLFIVLRGMYIASCGQDNFSRLLAGSLSLTFFIYVFVNVGMVSGLLPIVGVPLPLISYGGTSLVTLLAAFGILMSIHTHRKAIVD